MSPIPRVSYLALDNLGTTIDGVAVEDFKLLTGVLDVAVRLFHNIRVSVLRSFRDFRRSELRAYHESHVLAVRTLYAEKKITLLSTLVPVPHEMIVSYPKALQRIGHLLTQLQIEKTLSSAAGVTSHLGVFLNADDYRTYTGNINETTKLISRVTRRDIDELIKSIFHEGSKGPEQIAMRDAFGSFAELKQVDDQLLDYETLFKKAPAFCAAVNDMEHDVDAAVGQLARLDQPDRDFLKALHAFVYATAVQLDCYGVILAILQKLEHNLVISLARLIQVR